MPTYSITTIDPPGSVNAYAVSINASAQIVGTDGFNGGYLDSGGTFTTITLQGAVTAVFGSHSINDLGQIVGWSGADGFMDSGGTFTPIDVPGASGRTEPLGINDSGQITGFYEDRSGAHAFFYDHGTYTPISLPGNAYEQFDIGINASGQVVGSYIDSSNSNVIHGFLYSGGTVTTIDPPGSHATYPHSINFSGQIVGSYLDSSNVEHGFLYSGSTFTPINVPGSISTEVTGINDLGQIIGDYVDSSGQDHGFLDIGGNFTNIDVPGSSETLPIDINNSGTITGFYYAGSDPNHNVPLAFMAALAPVMVADRANVQTAGTVEGNVLANDTDPVTGDTLTVSAVDGQTVGAGQPATVPGAYGTLTLGSNGDYSYAASSSASILPADGVGLDVFTYTAETGQGGIASTTLTVVVTSSSVTYEGGNAGVTIQGGNGGGLVLDGGAGNDVVIAGKGATVLIGGPGDTLTGGKGSDTFIFVGDFGSNTITNFNPHRDIIQLATSEFTDFTTLQQNDMKLVNGTDTLITNPHDSDDTITLLGITPSHLHASDFQFV
jgi:VCBS repeat-containing protein